MTRLTTLREWVLILVLMEDALGVVIDFSKEKIFDSLNPCFNGRCSRRAVEQLKNWLLLDVLILVLMEDALGEILFQTKSFDRQKS